MSADQTLAELFDGLAPSLARLLSSPLMRRILRALGYGPGAGKTLHELIDLIPLRGGIAIEDQLLALEECGVITLFASVPGVNGEDRAGAIYAADPAEDRRVKEILEATAQADEAEALRDLARRGEAEEVSDPPHPLEFDWGALVSRIVHPTKVEIVEAMRWIGAPLSPYDLRKVLDARHRTSSITNHLDGLAGADAIGVIDSRQTRGSRKTFHFLRDHQLDRSNDGPSSPSAEKLARLPRAGQEYSS